MSPTRSHRSKVLIVDDVPANVDLLYQTLAPKEYTILAAPSGEVALRLAAEAAPDLILLDLLMPGMDGLETCRRLKGNEATRDIPVVFITARHETSALVSGFSQGGVDYITKPFQPEEVLARVETHLHISQLTRELQKTNAELRTEIDRREQAEASLARADQTLNLLTQREAERLGVSAFIGTTPKHAELLASIRKLQPVNTAVLITGESGTGKELVARALHFGGTRAKGPFIAVNCAAIAPDMAESELFGHVKGAFSGATADRKGAFELAHGGTLFLDEVADMPLQQQAKLLRVLESGTVWRLGAQHEIKVDVRVITATNANLEARRSAGEFRDDLYFRLARYEIRVSPLRERLEDIPLLAAHFVRHLAVEMGRKPPLLTVEAQERLLAHHWPGNVRELRNVIERALLECDGDAIRASQILPGNPLAARVPGPASKAMPDPLQFSGQGQLPWNLNAAELVLIRRAIEQTRGNLSQAAELLGIDRGKLYRRLAATGEANPETTGTP